MKIYLDTSSLFKLYQKEADSVTFDELFINSRISDIFISEIAKIEFVSAIYKKVRMKATRLEDAKKAIELFDNDIKKYFIVPLESNLIIKAKQLIVTYGKQGLRTLDSIQLVSALAVRNEVDKYFTSDRLLHILFEKENLPMA
ncbi:MAG: type II toxin-antitoxin system VapC family toxin [Ginsengibacter sp.]